MEFRSQGPEDGAVVVELSALTDSRLPFWRKQTHRTSAISAPAHGKPLPEYAASEDEISKQQGQRGLSTLAQIKDLGSPLLEIESNEMPRGTDNKLIAMELARLEGARLCSCDSTIISRAKTESIPVIDLAVLTDVLSSGVQPGDSLKLRIERAGDQKGQGIGYHRDGSMVVVGDADDKVGEEIMVLVKRLHHTAQGRMIFAEESQAHELRRKTNSFRKST